MLPMNRRMHVGWILALGLISVPLAGACSSGTTDVSDSGSGSPSSGGGSSSSSSGGGSSSSSGGGSSSSSSGGSGGGSDAGPTILFLFDDATGPTDPGMWPGDSYCILQTTIPGSVVPEAGSDASGDAAPVEAAAPSGCNPTPANEVFLQALSTVTYDSTQGDSLVGGDQGSLEIVVPFSGYNQQADFQHIFASPLNILANKTLFVRYRLDSGFNPNPSAQGGFYLAVKTGTGYTYASTTYTNVMGVTPPGMWNEVDLPMASPPFVDTTNPIPYDQTNVVAIEIHFDTGSGPTTPVDGGALPSTATFHIDTIGFF